MPNWCSNTLTISTTKDGRKVSKVLELIHTPASDDNDERIFDFDKVIPYPDNFKLMDKTARKFEVELSEANTDEGRNAVCSKYGAEPDCLWIKDGYNSGGYSWCVENWNTKWNACEVQILSQDDSSATLRFDTAWSPPIPVIEKLGQLFPDFRFELQYSEDGIGFEGNLVIDEGETQENESRDIVCSESASEE